MHSLKILCSVVVSLFVFASCQSDEKEIKPKPAASKIESLKYEVNKHPDSLMLIEDLIEAYRNENYYDSAIALTDEQIRKDSGNAYLWNIKATLFFENGDTTNAIKSLQHAVEIYPLPDYLIALGTIYAETKNENAITIADELLQSNRTKTGKDAWFIKGLYYNYTSQPQKAISYLDSCLHEDYTYMYAYREKAIALYSLEKYNKAVAVLKRAITLQNNFDEGYFWMGKCYEKLNQKEKAMESYQAALLYDKDFVEAREALKKIQDNAADTPQH